MRVGIAVGGVAALVVMVAWLLRSEPPDARTPRVATGESVAMVPTTTPAAERRDAPTIAMQEPIEAWDARNPDLEETSIDLLVLTEEGHPAPGARVLVADETQLDVRSDDVVFWARPDAEQQLERRGRALETDGRGRTRVTDLRGLAFVAARRGEMFGLRTGGIRGTGSATITLYRDRAVMVEVVDEQGNPRPDTPVALSRSYDDLESHLFVGTPRPGETSVRIDGIRWRTARTNPDQWTLFSVAPFVALHARPREARGWARIDPERLPDEPIRLVVGPTGRIRVRVENADGSPYLKPGSVICTLLASQIARDVVDGEAVFSHVATSPPALFYVWLHPDPRRYTDWVDRSERIVIKHEGGRTPDREVVLVGAPTRAA